MRERESARERERVRKSERERESEMEGEGGSSAPVGYCADLEKFPVPREAFELGANEHYVTKL